MVNWVDFLSMILLAALFMTGARFERQIQS